jgi:hypothetical protein
LFFLVVAFIEECKIIHIYANIDVFVDSGISDVTMEKAGVDARIMRRWGES